MNIQFNTHGTIDNSFTIEKFSDERMPAYFLIKFTKMMIWIFKIKQITIVVIVVIKLTKLRDVIYNSQSYQEVICVTK